MGASSAQVLICWDPPQGFDAGGADGSLVLESVSDISGAVSGVYSRILVTSWDGGVPLGWQGLGSFG